MRRKDREITDIKDICSIIDSCKVFRVAMSVDNVPYIVPLNYGYQYKDNAFEFYFHCANSGKKLDMMRKNEIVCFEMDCAHELTTGDIACDYGYNYKSIIGTGKVEFVEDVSDKTSMLSNLMKHQTSKEFLFTHKQVSAVTVCKIKVIEISAKQRAK